MVAKSLCEAWYNGDASNREKLQNAFPDYFSKETMNFK
jgi:hypothetical protein